MKLLYPVGTKYPVSQSYAGHVATAKKYGWCSKPGNCLGGTYYYGGIDWACPTGTPVYAADGGRVEKQDQGNDGYGLNIRITHKNGYYTIYAHLQTVLFKTGDDVSAGSLIAFSDDTGNSSGPHIHFELRLNGTPIDPQPYLTTDVPDTEPEPPTEFTLPHIPDYSHVRVTKAISGYLNVRQLPVMGRVIGKLYPGDTIPVLGIFQDNANYWYAIALPDNTLGWAAALYGGETWLEVI